MAYSFSIVIPLWNKDYEISLVLAALAANRFPVDDYEVIIVDDGSANSLAHLETAFSGRLNLKYIRKERGGNRAQNRNHGARLSRGEYLIFLDSDMVASPDLLQRFRQAVNEGGPGNVVLGTRRLLLEYDKNYLDEDTVEKGFDLIRSLPAIEDERTLAINYSRESGKEWAGKWQWGFSHCYCLAREAFFAVGGFDEEFGRDWGAEDVELSYRLHKAGLRFRLDESLVCYHLHHPVDFLANYESMKRNYALFIRKHPDWGVELFTRESETWAIEGLDIQAGILERRHLVPGLRDREWFLDKIPPHTVVFGIDDPVLLLDARVEKAYIPNGTAKSAAVADAIGIQTGLPDGAFGLALVSERYRDLSYGLFREVVREAQRLAKRVLLVRDGAKEETDPERQETGIKRAARPVVLFALSNEFYFNHQKYYYQKLALALRAHGVDVGIQMAYDPRRSLDCNEGYLRIDSQESVSALARMRDHGLNFIGADVPTVMELNCAQSNQRNLRKRIFWQEMRFRFHEKALMNGPLRTYSRFLARRPSDLKILKSSLPTGLLEIGVDGKLVEAYRKSAASAGGMGPFRFIWTGLFTDAGCGLDVLLEAFAQEFRSERDVALDVLLPDNFLPFRKSEYCNELMTGMFRASSEFHKSAYDRRAAGLREMYRDCPGIRFIQGRTTESDVFAAVSGADCLIDAGSSMSMNPAVSFALSLGKTVMGPNDGRWQGYWEPGSFIEIDSVPRNAAFHDGAMQSPFLSDRDPTRYLLARRLEPAALRKALRHAYLNRPAAELSMARSAQFASRFSWEAIAERFLALLEGMWAT